MNKFICAIVIMDLVLDIFSSAFYAVKYNLLCFTIVTNFGHGMHCNDWKPDISILTFFYYYILSHKLPQHTLIYLCHYVNLSRITVLNTLSYNRTLYICFSEEPLSIVYWSTINAVTLCFVALPNSCASSNRRVITQWVMCWRVECRKISTSDNKPRNLISEKRQ